jgi:hypothetical protein
MNESQLINERMYYQNLIVEFDAHTKQHTSIKDALNSIEQLLNEIKLTRLLTKEDS